MTNWIQFALSIKPVNIADRFRFSMNWSTNTNRLSRLLWMKKAHSQNWLFVFLPSCFFIEGNSVVGIWLESTEWSMPTDQAIPGCCCFLVPVVWSEQQHVCLLIRSWRLARWTTFSVPVEKRGEGIRFDKDRFSSLVSLFFYFQAPWVLRCVCMFANCSFALACTWSPIWTGL